MSVFIVTYVHPDEQLWNQFLGPHLEWIQRQLDDNVILASGPLPDESSLAALIILAARDRAHVDQVLAEDPFVVEGLVTELTVQRWEPIFGLLAGCA